MCIYFLMSSNWWQVKYYSGAFIIFLKLKSYLYILPRSETVTASSVAILPTHPSFFLPTYQPSTITLHTESILYLIDCLIVVKNTFKPFVLHFLQPWQNILYHPNTFRSSALQHFYTSPARFENILCFLFSPWLCTEYLCSIVSFLATKSTWWILLHVQTLYGTIKNSSLWYYTWIIGCSEERLHFSVRWNLPSRCPSSLWRDAIATPPG